MSKNKGIKRMLSYKPKNNFGIEVNLSDIKGAIKQLDEAVSKRKHTFDLPLGYIGDELYRISDSCIGNKAAWDSFNKALLDYITDKINTQKHGSGHS